MRSFSPRYAIISDIHSNLAAVRVVLDAIAADGVAATFCLGDLVGYGPNPHEVVKEIEGLPLHCIRGNHDRYALDLSSDDIRAATSEAIEFTKRTLTPADVSFLKGLPDSTTFDDRVLLVHGSPRNPDEYIVSGEVAVASYKHFRDHYAGMWLCLFGHTHVPMIIGDGRVVRQIEPNSTVKLKPRMPYLINPGSVGQPRDGNPEAAYGILDLDEYTMTFRRVPYDVEDTHRRILEAGLQRHLGDRLRVGK